ncbi:MAG: glycosyltransferase family 4 protein [Solirubrobacterales bacterium]|nr:glycosyltransferase family 4 protein [Solirubrobacterales bacterium]
MLFVTGHVPAYRVGALARLHELEGIEVALVGGFSKHGGPELAGELPFPHRHVTPRECFALAASAEHRAVVLPTGGRLALLAGWAGARAGATPLILWASLWAHPRSLPHALSYLPLRRLYRAADAVVTYGPHVSAYVSARGARNVHVAPQAVENDFWRSEEPGAVRFGDLPQATTRFLFVGRDAPEKGLDVLREAWRESGLRPPAAALVLAGSGAATATALGASDGIVAFDTLSPEQLRSLYDACDVLVVPSVATRTFREPWGLVVNEAMNRGLAVIASDTVGAAAGGLVHDGANGVIVPAAQPRALAQALQRLAAEEPLRTAMGAAGAHDVLGYDYEVWAQGFSRALATLGLARGRW